MKKLFIKLLLKLNARYMPSYKRVRHYKTVLVKKGKIREWRTYDQNGNRLAEVMK